MALPAERVIYRLKSIAVDVRWAGLELLRGDVLRAIKEDGFCGLAVAARAADLLVVSVEGVGNVRVVNKADVGLIDARAEGVGGHDHGHLSAHETVLNLLPLPGPQSAMKERRGHASPIEIRRDGLGIFMRGNVDDTGFVSEFDTANYRSLLLALR